MRQLAGWHVDAMGIARGVIGAALLVGAGPVTRRIPLRTSQRPIAVAGRLLGGRHVIEAVALSRWRLARLRRVVAAVDILHGASMVAIAVRSRDLRPVATAAAAEACGLAAASLV